MTKFKVGDKVKIVGATGYRAKYNGNIEVIRYINPNHDNQKAHYGIEGSFWIFYETELEPAKPVRQSIHIYHDGKTTTARLCEGKEVVKTATAICHPDDEFDFEIGAELAFGRLFGKEPTVKPSIDWDAFKQGKLAVHCDTEEKATAFLKECEREGLKWAGGEKATAYSLWGAYKGNSCYCRSWAKGGIQFSSKVHYSAEGTEVVPYRRKEYIMKDIEADLLIANAEIKQLKAERDAAVQDFTSAAHNGNILCEFCGADCIDAGNDTGGDTCQCGCFEWRGVKGVHHDK